MALSFLCRAFCRVLQPTRLSCRSGTELAGEVVIRRREVPEPQYQVVDRSSSRQIGGCWRAL